MATRSGGPTPSGDGRPLSARSLILSALLGSHPPTLPVRALVAFGEIFGFASGTVRTALSRMAAAGELEARDCSYALGPLLRERQERQIERIVAPDPWDGTWWVAIADASGRSLGDRRAFRERMLAERMGELRPDIWLRPANIPPPSASGLLIARGPVEGSDPRALASRLWPIAALDAEGRALLRDARAALRQLQRPVPD